MRTIGEIVAKRIDEFLYQRGMSLYGLAKKTGLPLSTLKNLYTKHTKSPTLALMYKICDGLDVSINDFLNSSIFRMEAVENVIYR